jgi:hypothetical protein
VGESKCWPVGVSAGIIDKSSPHLSEYVRVLVSESVGLAECWLVGVLEG